MTELRLQNLQVLGKELLSDLPGYENVISKITSVLKETEKKRQQLVDSWVKQLTFDLIFLKPFLQVKKVFFFFYYCRLKTPKTQLRRRS